MNALLRRLRTEPGTALLLALLRWVVVEAQPVRGACGRAAHANQTCNTGLVCLSNVCVSEGTGGAGGASASGGAGGKMGTAGTTGQGGTQARRTTAPRAAGATLSRRGRAEHGRSRTTGSAGTSGAAERRRSRTTGAAGTTGVAGTTGAAGTSGAAGTTGAADIRCRGERGLRMPRGGELLLVPVVRRPDPHTDSSVRRRDVLRRKYCGTIDDRHRARRYLRLYRLEVGPLSRDITTGTFTLTSDDAQAATCSICVFLYADLNLAANPATSAATYIATSGTVISTSLADKTSSTGTIAGSLSNVTFQQVTIDPTSQSFHAGSLVQLQRLEPIVLGRLHAQHIHELSGPARAADPAAPRRRRRRLSGRSV